MSDKNGGLFSDKQDEKQKDDIFSSDEQIDSSEKEDTWKILIVDDEEDIHQVTQMALKTFTYKNKKIKFLDAYSASEASKILKENNDIAVILLDVVMETNNAGLELVKEIREKFCNYFTRIILRTGQPGQAPEKEVIEKYEINDYKTKTELTTDKLYTVIMASLRAFEALETIDSFRRNLEEKVKERTKEVVAQKEEIQQQQKEITDSILYAERIQRAVLPSDDYVKKILGEHFILFKPKDIVSGDFYWVAKIKKWLIIVAADCTGHGVPGGFMSMLGVAFLNEIVNNEEITQANYALNELRSYIIKSLQQTGKKGEAQDGMDIAFIAIDVNTNKMQFAGANNPLYMIRKNANTNGQTDILEETKGDKMPIGIQIIADLPSFTNHEIQLTKGDTIYIFSDGYADQFGGPQGKKFKNKQFKQLLIDIHKKDMTEQNAIFNKTFEDWKGELEQVDDVLVMGIRI